MEDIRLTQLGREVRRFASPKEAVLETVPNPQAGDLFLARFTVPEFTSLCPVTGQPDFARLVIDYAPADRLVESKSLKLYLASFRNHGAFHEVIRRPTDLCGKFPKPGFTFRLKANDHESESKEDKRNCQN